MRDALRRPSLVATGARLATLATLATLAALTAVVFAACTPAPRGGARPRPAGPEEPRTETSAPGDAALERAVLAELNRARSDPAAYAEALDALVPHFEGKVLRRPGTSVGLSTQEGPAAVIEAAAALRATAPVAPLRLEDGLSQAARDHVRDSGPSGLVGHVGTDGSTTADRASRHGRWRIRLTESIQYGSETGRYVIVALIVDDGVPSRGHRINAFDPAVATVGIACGPHRQYRRMCVIVHAGEYEAPR